MTTESVQFADSKIKPWVNEGVLVCTWNQQ